jgi:hypothetical protein
MHDFDKEFDRQIQQINKVNRLAMVMGTAAVLLSVGILALIIWAVIKLANHFL